MIDIPSDRARALCGIPDDVRPLTALAIGYEGDPAASSKEIRDRDLAPWRRRPLSELVYEGHWGESSRLVT